MRVRRLLPIAFFVLLLTHGAGLGLTDDEAYYWVLAQRPSLGYAFHPPAIGWFIAAVQKLLGPLFGGASPVLVRLPGVLSMALVLKLGLDWVAEVGGARTKEQEIRADLVLLSFSGLFACCSGGGGGTEPRVPLRAWWGGAAWAGAT